MRWLLSLVALSVLAAGAFWESKPVETWNSNQVRTFLSASPWARPLVANIRMANSIRVDAYLATAAIVSAAEQRRLALSGRPLSEGAQMLAEDYSAYLQENRARVVGLAIPAGGDARADLEDAQQIEQIRKESLLRSGGKTYRVVELFPPTPSDPYLRLFFQRPSDPGDRLSFELYLPHVPGAYRTVDFEAPALLRDGRPDY